MGNISNTDDFVYLHPPLSCVVCVQLSGCPVLVKNEVCPCVCVCTQREVYVQYGDVGHVECDVSRASVVFVKRIR